MNFYEFLAAYGIIGFSVSTSLGLSFYNFINSISDEIIIPFLYMIFNVKKFYAPNVVSNLITYILIISIIYVLSTFFFHNLITTVHKLKNNQKLLDENIKIRKLLEKYN